MGTLLVRTVTTPVQAEDRLHVDVAGTMSVVDLASLHTVSGVGRVTIDVTEGTLRSGCFTRATSDIALVGVLLGPARRPSMSST